MIPRKLDIRRIEELLSVFESLSGLIVIDEIQRLPWLFPLLRYQVDTGQDRKFLIPGSASKALSRQSSESLAGRIGYHYLGGFTPFDVGFENLSKEIEAVPDFHGFPYPESFFSRPHGLRGNAKEDAPASHKTTEGATWQERSRYRIFDDQYPFFLTGSTVDWIPLFAKPDLVRIILEW